MTKTLLKMGVIVTVMILWTVVAQGTWDTFYAQGVAPVQQGQLNAKANAMKDFKQQILIQALLEIAGPEVVKDQKAILEREILSNPDRFIQTYRILSENVADGLYRINGEAEIIRQKLLDELSSLGVLNVSTSAPAAEEYTDHNGRTVLWIVEPSCPESVDGTRADSLFGNMLIGTLTEKGWMVNMSEGDKILDGQQVSARWIVKSTLTCPLEPAKTSIGGTIEIRDAEKRTIVAVISERTERELEGPILEGIISLTELIAPQLVQILATNTPQPKSIPSDNQAPKSQNSTEGSLAAVPSPTSKPFFEYTWEIIIHDYPFLPQWERIERALREKSLEFTIYRMQISENGCQVWIKDAPSSLPQYLSHIQFDNQTKILIDYLDPEERRISLRIVNSSQLSPNINGQ